MQFVRNIDWTAPGFEGPGGYKGLLLYFGETGAMVATRIPAGVAGPPRHMHPHADQLFMVTEGELTISLGGEVQKVAAHGLVFVSAGVPHQVSNEGASVAAWVEVLAPGSAPGQSAMEYVEGTEDQDGLWYVRPHDPANEIFFDGYAHFGVEWLANRSMGSRHASLYLARMSAGGESLPLHTHAFDQFYLVLEGTISVQIGLEQFEVRPGNLVVLPAGVPHRQWNGSTEPSYSAVMILPEPLRPVTEEPWDTPVTLEPSAPIEIPDRTDAED